MDPVEPWIDAEAVRRLARQLVEPPGSDKPLPEPDAGFGPGFEGFITGGPPPLPRSAVSDPPNEPPPTAAPAPRDPGTEDAPAKPFLVHPATGDAPPPTERELPRQVSEPLLARLSRFRTWLIDQLDARGAFVLERDGEPVLDDPAFAKLHFLARSLAQAYRPVKGEVGNVHVKVGADAYLAVVPVDTAFGRLVLGAVLPEPLDAAAVQIVADTLKRAASPPRR